VAQPFRAAGARWARGALGALGISLRKGRERPLSLVTGEIFTSALFKANEPDAAVRRTEADESAHVIKQRRGANHMF